MKWLLPCFCLMAFITSCGSDNDGDGPGRQGKPISELTPDENKKELENIGLNLLSKINPEDHVALGKTIAKFEEITSYSVVEEPGIMNMLKSINTVCAKTDLSEMLALASTRTTVDEFLYGIWEYNESNSGWDRKEVGGPGEVEYRFKVERTAASIKANYSEATIDFENEAIPISLGLQVSLGNEKLAEFALAMDPKPTFDMPTEVGVNCVLNAGGYLFGVDATLQESGTSSVVTSFAKDNEVLLSFNTYGKTAFNDDIPVKNAEAELRILNDLSVTVSCSNVQKCYEKINALDWQSTESDYRECAQVINQYTSGELRYVESDYVVAKVMFEAYNDDINGDGVVNDNDWDIETLIVFSQDGSKHSFDSYFDEVGFQSLLVKAAELTKRYESLF